MATRIEATQAVLKAIREDRLTEAPISVTNIAIRALDKLNIFDREGETKLELQGDGPNQTIVVTNPDGTVKHARIPDHWWIEGGPRPTEPGVYQDTAHPDRIYTLYESGNWRSNRQMLNQNLDIRSIPSTLNKIA